MNSDADFDDLLRSSGSSRAPLPSASLYTSESDDLGFQSNPFADLESSAYQSKPYAAYEEKRNSAPASPVEEKRQQLPELAANSPRTRAYSVSSSTGSVKAASPTVASRTRTVSNATNGSLESPKRPAELKASASYTSAASIGSPVSSGFESGNNTGQYDAMVSPLAEESRREKELSLDARLAGVEQPSSAASTAPSTPSIPATPIEEEPALKPSSSRSSLSTPSFDIPAPRQEADNASVHTTSNSIKTVGLSSHASNSTASLHSNITEQAPAFTTVNTEGRPSFLITVSDPQKVGSDITASAHTVYTIRSVSSSAPNAPRTVLRRFRDFLWLYDTLSINNPGCIIPPPPEKHALGRFGELFVEARRKALQVFVGKVAAHPMLWNDPDFKMFLESETFAIDIKHRAPPATTPSTPSFSPSFLPGILTGVPRFVETDEFFSARQAQITALEPSLRTLTNSFHLVSKARATLSTSIGELASSVADLESCSLSAPAKKALEGLEGLQSRLRVLEENGSAGLESTLASISDSWVRLSSNSMKGVLAARVRCWTAWQKQLGVIKNVRITLEKRKNQGLVLQGSMAELVEAERRAEELKREYEDVTKLIKSEMVRFEIEKVDDFRLALAEYVDGLCKKQEEVSKAWDTYKELVQNVMGKNPAAQSPQAQTNGQNSGTNNVQ